MLGETSEKFFFNPILEFLGGILTHHEKDNRKQSYISLSEASPGCCLAGTNGNTLGPMIYPQGLAESSIQGTYPGNIYMQVAEHFAGKKVLPQGCLKYAYS